MIMKWQVHRAYSFQKADEFNENFWQRAGAQARFSGTWLMIMDFYKMRGKRGRLPRLRRSVQNIKYTWD